MSVLLFLSMKKICYIPLGEYRLQIVKGRLYCEVGGDGTISVEEYKRPQKMLKYIYHQKDWYHAVQHIFLCT
jgi:hypothetical protein